MKMNVKGDDGMRTPKYVFEHLNRIFGFTYDAACTRENSLCFTGGHEKHGLIDSWKGLRVFCNPPFSEKAKWIEKAHSEVANNNCPVCVMILPSNSVDSAPFHQYIFGRYHYDILEGRISFLDADGKPKTGNNSGTIIVYFMKKLKPVARGV